MPGPRPSASLLVLLAATTSTPLASARPSSDALVLLAVGHPVPGLPGSEILLLEDVAVNGRGDWVTRIHYDLAGDRQDVFWGGGPSDGGQVLRTRATIGDLRQEEIRQPALDDAGRIFYSAVCTNLSTSRSSVYSLWLDDTPVAVRYEATPGVPGNQWLVGKWPKITPSGMPYFSATYQVVGSVTATPNGEGAWVGPGPTLLYDSGDVLPGFAEPLLAQPASSETIKSSFHFSRNGTHHVSGVGTDSNTYVLLDGAAMTIEGRTLRGNEPLPASWQAFAGERWGSIGFELGVTEDGKYLVGGSTNAPSSTNDLLVVNGEIFFREGDVVDGRELYLAKRGAHLSEREDVVMLWRFDDPSSFQTPNALFLNGRVLLEDGAAVDVDGDGSDDATVSLWSGSALVGEDRTVYVSGDLDTPGVDLALLRLPVHDLEADVTELSVTRGGTVELTLFAPRDEAPTHARLFASVTRPVLGLTPGARTRSRTVRLRDVSREPIELDALQTARTSLTLPAQTTRRLAGATLTVGYVALGGESGEPVRSRTVEIALVP